jgi:large subunit ribosomal protein L4
MTSVSHDMAVEAAPGHRRRAIRRQRPEPVTRRVVRRRADGTEAGEVSLEPAYFGIEPNRHVLHQVITAQLAAARAGTHSTRTRSEVRGGGAKPFRQKGIGRARQGSIRAAQWVGGGVALGPKPRRYEQRTPKKMVRLALASALSDRADEARVALVDRWPWEEPRTKDAIAALEALELFGRVLVVLEPDDVAARRSFGNLPHVVTVTVGELNAYDVLKSDWVVFTDATVPGGVGDAVAPEAAPAGRDDSSVEATEASAAEVAEESGGETAEDAASETAEAAASETAEDAASETAEDAGTDGGDSDEDDSEGAS